jgi:hypothetical protein
MLDPDLIFIPESQVTLVMGDPPSSLGGSQATTRSYPGHKRHGLTYSDRALRTGPGVVTGRTALPTPTRPVPYSVIVVTVNVTCLPDRSTATSHDVANPEQTTAPDSSVTRYARIVAPFAAGDVQRIVALRTAGVTVTTGASGIAAGVRNVDRATGLLPALLRALATIT